jgi:hypothetical protein
MNRSQRQFRLGEATGRASVRIPLAFSAATNSFVNFVSRSCITIDGFSVRSAVFAMKAFVCYTTHFEFGRRVDVDTITSCDSMQRKTIRYSS